MLKEWADKHEKLHLDDIGTIKELKEKSKVESDHTKKGQSKVLEFHECLEILCNICLEHIFYCRTWDAIYSQHEKKFPPPISLEKDVAKVQA